MLSDGKRTVKRTSGPNQDKWCWVDTLIVVQAIGVSSTACHVLLNANHYIAFCYLLSCFIKERQLSLEENRSPQMNCKNERGRARCRLEQRIPAFSTEKEDDHGQKHIVHGFKGRLMAAMKKSAFGRGEECSLMHAQ